MKAIINCILILGLSHICNAQTTNDTKNAGNHWIFGKNIHLEFKINKVEEHKFSNINLLELGTSISDSSGNLTYYIAGGGYEAYLFNSNYQKLEPFVGGDPSASQGLILMAHKHSDTTLLMLSWRGGGNNYYLVHNDSILNAYESLPFLGGEKQQAVNHQNGRDIWYANHAQNGDSIYFFLIKKNGMVECPVVTHTGLHYYGGDMGWSTQGQMKFSPNGKYLADMVYVDPFGYGVYRFNSEYPVNDSFYQWSKDFTPIYDKNWPVGVEFSPDGTKVYFLAGRNDPIQSPRHPVVLYQASIDSLLQDNQGDTWTSIDSLWGIDAGALQLAPNGKIYVAMPNQKYLGVINDPNELGAACNYQRQGLTLDSGGTCLYGLPTFNQSYFYTPQIDFRYEENCLTNEYEFWGADTFGAVNFEWRITDTRQLTQDTKQGRNVVFTFSADSLENKYKVTFIASNGTKTDSVTKTLTIRPKMQTDFLGRDTFYCAGSSFGLTLSTPEDLHCIHWGVNGEVLEPYSNLMGDTVIGYENFYGYILENTSRIIDTAGIYTARITNKAFCQVTDTIVVEEKPRPSKAVVSRLGNLLSCDVVANQYRWYYNGALYQTTDSNFLDPNQNGYWQVQLVSEFGCESELSDSFYVGFASIDPRLQDAGQLTFNIYPNPSDGHISIAVPKEGLYKIQIIDFNGRVIYSIKQNLSLFATANELEFVFARGTYTLQLTDEDGNVGVKKVVVE